MVQPISRRPTSGQAQLQHLHLSFLAIVPRITGHGSVYFRNVRCASTKDECLAEMTALAWLWWVRLHKKGKNPAQFVSAIATFAAKAVRSGRRLCGQEKAKDVMSPRAQKMKGFTVGKLPDFSTLSSNPLAEALTESTKSPPDEAAAFRIDFPAWLASLGDTKRRVAEALMMGDRTSDVANKHGYSAGRISQMRREMMEYWNVYGGYLAGEQS